MKRTLLAALLLAAPLVAQQNQERTTQNQERTTKLVHLKYVDPGVVRGMIAQFGVTPVPDSTMKAMTLSGSPAQIAAAEAALQQLDIPPKNIELVVYFVVGSDQPNLTGSAVPSDIRDVIAQLKGTFTYKDYRMLDTLTLRTREGSRADTTGILDSRSSPPRLTKFAIFGSSVSSDGSTVRIDRLHAGLRIPVGGPKPEYVDTGVDQDIDVKEGQKVVVGRASLEGPDKALFLILTARVM